MAEKIRQVMTSDLVTLPMTATVGEAARAMREDDIGDVIVLDAGRVAGIVTDRDIVVRGIAAGRDPGQTRLADICSRELATISPSADVEDAVKMMKDKALRRLPVVENGRPVGVVSLGDLAVERDPNSALGTISAAPPNR
jgi:CBS domain-containing protein